MIAAPQPARLTTPAAPPTPPGRIEPGPETAPFAQVLDAQAPLAPARPVAAAGGMQLPPQVVPAGAAQPATRVQTPPPAPLATKAPVRPGVARDTTPAPRAKPLRDAPAPDAPQPTTPAAPAEPPIVPIVAATAGAVAVAMVAAPAARDDSGDDLPGDAAPAGKAAPHLPASRFVPQPALPSLAAILPDSPAPRAPAPAAAVATRAAPAAQPAPPDLKAPARSATEQAAPAGAAPGAATPPPPLAAPAALLHAVPGTHAATPGNAASPVDFGTLVESIARARAETSAAAPVAVTVQHQDFGRVSLQFSAHDQGLTVNLRSADPGFAPAAVAAVQATAPASSSGSTHDQTHRDPSGAQARHDAPSGGGRGNGPESGAGQQRPAPLRRSTQPAHSRDSADDQSGVFA